MKSTPATICFCLIAIGAFTKALAAEVRVCNKSEYVLNNLEVNSFKYHKLDIGECTAYYKDPLAQKYVSLGINMDGKRLGFKPKGAPVILEEGRYSYQVLLKTDQLQLETVKD